MLLVVDVDVELVEEMELLLFDVLSEYLGE